MYQFAWHNSFKHAFKRVTKNNTELRRNIIDSLELLQENPFNPKLKTHKLHGKLKEYWGSIVDYDCRIVFAFTSPPDSDDEVIALTRIIH